MAHFFLRLDELETRGAFVGGRAGDGARGSLAAVHQEILIALARPLRRVISMSIMSGAAVVHP